MDHRLSVALLLLLCLWSPATSGRGGKGHPHVRGPELGPLPVAGQTVAGRFLSARYLARGPRAHGRVGDYFVRSRRLLAVIRADDGTLIDLALGPRFVDQLGWGVTTVCDSHGRLPLQVERVTILTRRRDRRSAILLQGAVRRGRSRLEVSTELRIPPEASYLELTTTLTNRQRQVWHNVGVCDHLGTGNVPLWIEGVGAPRRPGTYRGRFCGRTENGLSTVVAVRPAAAPMQLRLDFSPPVPAFDPAIDADYGRSNLKPGQRVVARRVVALARGGLDRALAKALRATGQARRQLTVGGASRPGVELVLRRAGAPFLLATPGKGDTYALTLPRGTYQLSMRLPGAGEGPAVAIPADLSSVTVSPPTVGGLRVAVAVDGKAGVPVKLQLAGVRGTPDPDFGRAPGLRVENVVYSVDGDETLALPPGHYRVTASRGPDYTLESRPVQVQAEKTVSLRLKLKRLVGAGRWAATDLHLHTRASFDSPVRARHRLIAASAVGLDLVVLTDHNAVTRAHTAGVPHAPLVVAGQEVTTRGNLFGHFNVFPLKAPVGWLNTTPSRLFRQARNAGAEVTIQVNHPRMGSIGYFDQMGLDPRSGRARVPGYDGGFDLLEVFNGDHLERPDRVQRVLEDWFALLQRGQRYVATGGSDSHRLPYQDAGYPRTYVLRSTAGGQPTARQILAALRAGRAVVSTGPRVELTVDGQPMGSTVKGQKGRALSLHLRVDAAPWIELSTLELWERGRRRRSFAVRGRRSPLRFQRNLTIRPTRDTWFVALVRGGKPDPTLTRKVLPWAMTNPVWVDADGDGKLQLSSTGGAGR